MRSMNPVITFFRQSRRDGGLRTGIDLNDELVYGNYVGPEDFDPVLDWYVDFQFSGPSVPGDRKRIKRWLISRSDEVRRVLRQQIAELRSGIDHEALPVVSEHRGKNSDDRLVIRVSASNRAASREIPRIFRDFEKHWSDEIRALPLAQPIGTITE